MQCFNACIVCPGMVKDIASLILWILLWIMVIIYLYILSLLFSANTLYEDQHPDMECNPAYVLVNKKVEDDQSLQSIPRCDTYI